MAEDKELQDLIGFLGSPKKQVQKAAVDLVEGLTGSVDGLEQLMSHSGSLLPALLRLIAGDTDTSRAALNSLINLSQREDAVQRLTELKVVGRIMDYLTEGLSPHVELLMMLLSNVTVSDPACEQLLQLKSRSVTGFNIAVLLKRFVDSRDEIPDPYQHMALVLTNLTRQASGRQLLLEQGRGTFPALASQLSAPSVLRQSGCANAIRNCCFCAEEDGTLDRILEDTRSLEMVLEALCGVSRAKEQNDDVRIALAESIELLARLSHHTKTIFVATVKGSQVLWDLKAPEMLRKGYETEENAEVCASMERIANGFLAEMEAT